LQSVKPLAITDSEPVDWIVQRIIPLYPLETRTKFSFRGVYGLAGVYWEWSKKRNVSRYFVRRYGYDFVIPIPAAMR
jgi:hypothetical protein